MYLLIQTSDSSVNVENREREHKNMSDEVCAALIGFQCTHLINQEKKKNERKEKSLIKGNFVVLLKIQGELNFLFM